MAVEKGHITITISLWNLQDSNGEIRVFGFQDAPEFRTTGGLIDLPLHEALEFLERAGLSQEKAQQLLEEVLRQPARVHRRRFDLSPVQLERLREFAPEFITAL